MGRYAFLESVAVADCAVEVEGRDLDDLFTTAAVALAEIMVDPATVPIVETRTISLTAPALDLLLFDWLSELIYLKDSEHVVFTRAEVEVREADAFTLTARVAGGPIDRDATALRADPKAVTFHRFEIAPADAGWRARLVIDI